MKFINQTPLKKIERRDFLKTSTLGASGLLLGFHISCSRPFEEEIKEASIFFDPNVYLSINDLGEVTIVAHRSEMGTGIRTSLPTIVADELAADWSKVKIVQALGDEEIYGNQNTDGSFSGRMFYEPMRQAGAAARMMLEQAAADQWGVDASECNALNHEIIHSGSGKKLGFGDLAEAASKLTVPAVEDIKLKNPEDFTLIGKETPIYDLQDIVMGTAGFGIDAQTEGMKISVVARCPVAGGKVQSYDAEETLKVPGVLGVHELEAPAFPMGFNPLGGIAVVAENTWAAIKGRDALNITWDEGANAVYNSESYMSDMVTEIQKPGTVRREEGDIKKALATSSKTLESTYQIPHLSHTPMEPPNTLAHVTEGKCVIWAPTQHPQWVKGTVAAALELDPGNVEVHVTLLGGAFGRKSKPDFATEAALISQKAGVPIKLIWTREDDVHHDYLHACSAQHVKVGLDENNQVIAWNHHSAFPSIGGTSSPDAIQPADFELSLGMLDFPYDIPNICCESHDAPAHTRIGWLRSVCNIQHAYAVGSMLDEVAHLRKVDPVDNLLELLGEDRHIPFDKMMKDFPNYNEKVSDFPANTARMKNVIKLVADKSNWGKTLGSGRGQGICAHRSFLTYVACVVEVEIDENNQLSIPEIHFAVDCGVVVNRDRVKAQFEGGAVYGLSGALSSAITFDKGKVVQSNFHDYQVARINQAPGKVHVHFVDSSEKPTGVGEPPVPPIAPALCNAIFAATDKRLRELPIKLT